MSNIAFYYDNFNFLFKNSNLLKRETIKKIVVTKLLVHNKNNNTQIRAYLSISKLKTKIEKKWTKEKKDCAPIIDRVMIREQQYQDTHYVFYHGQEGRFRILQDIIKELYSVLHIKRTVV